MCEKPLHDRPRRARALDRTVKGTGRQLFIVYMNFTPTVTQHEVMSLDGGIGDRARVMHGLGRASCSPRPGTTRVPTPRRSCSTPCRGPSPPRRVRPAQLTTSSAWRWITSPRERGVRAHDGAPRRQGGAARRGRAPVHQWRDLDHGRGVRAPGSANNRHAVEVRGGLNGQFHLDLRDNVLWRYRPGGDELRAARGGCRALQPSVARSTRGRRRPRPQPGQQLARPSSARERSRSSMQPTARRRAGSWNRSHRPPTGVSIAADRRALHRGASASASKCETAARRRCNVIARPEPQIVAAQTQLGDGPLFVPCDVRSRRRSAPPSRAVDAFEGWTRW